MVTAGSRLGPYEILSAIGAGGMGEVYRARDTKLGRDVALKILPELFAADPDRLARFQREAELLASLNHPNIAGIYGFEESSPSAGSRQAPVRALVLELVEGPTLVDRIVRGAIPIDEALLIARQIADALEAAHEQGIIHRDLKPANIKLRPDGTVKVLDFGLAKLTDPVGASRPTTGNLTNSPTITTPAMTMAGVILGTAAYMSPEQAKGRPADRRSDIWAFGCVLYEMLTGIRPFAGEDVSDTLAFVITKEPDWTALPSGTPRTIHTVLRRCLEKNRKRRLADIADARLEIEDASIDSEALRGPTASRPSRRREALLGALAALLLLTTVGVLFRDRSQQMPEAPLVRFDVPPPPGGFSDPEVSPDGRMLAFLAPRDGKLLIWVRRLDSSDAVPLLSSEGARNPFWSPDSQFIGYVTSGKLKRVAAGGGPSRIVADLAENNYFGTWNADDVILLGSNQVGGGLLRVAASGGQPTPETELDPSRKERFHTVPYFLPDQRHFLYAAIASDPRNNAAYVGTLGSRERDRLPGIASQVKYAPGDHLVFVRDGALMVQRFDSARMQLVGEPSPIVDPFALPSALNAQFSVSGTGTLAYRPSAYPNRSRLVWFDRHGSQLGIAGPNGIYVNPELSPNKKYVAFDDGSGPVGDVRILDIEKGQISRLTSDPANDGLPQWSPDGRTIAFRSDRDGTGNLFARDVGVVGDDKPFLKTTVTKTPWDWSRDGRYIAYQADGDIWALPLFGDRQPLRITESPFVETNARVSPDGRWIAYQSSESGGSPSNDQVYIQSFPRGGAKQQVSAGGGRVPRWSFDGKELFYQAPDRTLMVVTVRPVGDSVEVGAPTALFRLPVSDPGGRNYSVASDGRFLVRVPADDQQPTPATVILNWAAGVKK